MVRRASPVRTCVGCRSRAPSSELLRVVAVGEVMEDGGGVRLVADVKHRLPGRGAHIHPDLTCLTKAERRRVFGRALRLTGVIDIEPLRDYLADLPQYGHTDGGPIPPRTRKVGTIDMSTR